MNPTEKNKIIEWLYLNDGKHSSKHEWREKFVSLLDSMTTVETSRVTYEDNVTYTTAVEGNMSSDIHGEVTENTLELPEYIVEDDRLDEETLLLLSKDKLRTCQYESTARREIKDLFTKHTDLSDYKINKIIKKLITDYSVEKEAGFEKIEGSKKVDPYFTY